MTYLTSLDNLVDHLEWHYNQPFHNVHKGKFDHKRNKYKVMIEQYCMFIAHNMSYFNEIWTLLTYMKLYDQNNKYRNCLKNIANKSIAEFRLFYTRKGTNRIEHLKKWFYDDEEYSDLATIEDMLNFTNYIPYDKVIELAKIYQSKLDKLIEFIADDNASTEDFINKEFFT